MALNRTKGEIVGDLGHDYVVVPLSRWGDTPLYDQAEMNAARAFMAAGALAPLSINHDEVLVQEYPAAHKLVFLFQRRIAGKEHFYPYVFELPADMVAGLRAAGRWGRKH